MRQLFISLVLLTFSLGLHAQCGQTNLAFTTGERVHYEAWYNWGFVWVHAGNVTFKTDAGTYNGKPAIALDAYGYSLKSYDWMYKVRDHFKAYIHPDDLRPLWFDRNTYEGGYWAHDRYVYDYSRQVVTAETENSKKAYSKETVPFKGCIFDVLSAVYAFRNLDIQALKPGDKIPVKVIIENKPYNLYMRFLGRETKETRDKKKYRCLKFSVLLVEGTIFKGGEDMFLWVTDDQNRIPVYVEAKILIGSVKAILKGTEGLKNSSRACIP